MKLPIVDLHCDLLSYLSYKPGRSPEDAESRVSISQLNSGNVQLQTLAIFTETEGGSLEKGKQQVDIFCALCKNYPLVFSPSKIQLIPAFENASGFSSPDEPIQTSLKRLESYRQLLGPIFYISMTWDMENRFGGGNRSTVGLKEDGKRLLEWLHDKKIAIDLSHTSDPLAYEIIEFIDRFSFSVPLIASHSNFRAITAMQRNLPDEIAKEIIRREGLIGINFFAPFIHPTDPLALLRHIEYGLSLGGENALCFGADFFADIDLHSIAKKYGIAFSYYPEYSDASKYPSILNFLQQKLSLKEPLLEKIASSNARHFLKNRIG